MSWLYETVNYYIWPTENSATYYFEHKRLGDDEAGRIWVKDNLIIDYDGVFELPKEILTALEGLGIHEEDETY